MCACACTLYESVHTFCILMCVCGHCVSVIMRACSIGFLCKDAESGELFCIVVLYRRMRRAGGGEVFDANCASVLHVALRSII